MALCREAADLGTRGARQLRLKGVPNLYTVCDGRYVDRIAAESSKMRESAWAAQHRV